MIATTNQLNKFAQQAGVKEQGELLVKLIERQEIVSPVIAKLISPEQFVFAKLP